MTSAYPIDPETASTNATEGGMSPTELAALVCSRICHDLVSPVGAIVNGIDLMRELGGSGEDELSMIGQSAGRAADLLQFHRLAFGAVPEGAGAIKRATLMQSARGVIASNRCSLSWTGEDGPPLERAEARLIGIMLLCSRSMLGLRGRITIATAPAAGVPVRVTAQSDSATCSDAHYAWIMSNGRTTLRPEAREVEFILVGPAAAATGATISVESGPGFVDLVASRGG